MGMNTIDVAEAWLRKYAGMIKTGNSFERLSFVLEQLGNPQNSYKVIHVAGTSGKGTTCWMMSHCIHQLGYKVGLTISPHMLDIRERYMINGQLLSEHDFVQYMNTIKSVIDTTDWAEIGQPSYFEIMIVAALYVFAQQGVDYAVLETGLGGRLDATNIVDSPDKLCVITSIGYDHQKFLGETLDLIATEKAMIVHPGNHCFTYHQESIVDTTIESVVQTQGGILHRVDTTHHYPLPGYFVGQHNQLNISVVDGVLQYLYDIGSIEQSVDVVSLMSNCPPLLARMQEIKRGTNTVIIDGAHNTQKMSALIQGLGEKFGPDQKYVFVVACKEDKNVGEVMDIILPKADYVITTEFGDLSQDYPIRAVDADEIIEYCYEYHAYMYCHKELNHSILFDLIKQKENHIIVITGSFYLASSFIKLLS